MLEQWMQRRIEIYTHQILEVLRVRRGERIHSIIGTGEGVHEVLEGSRDHLEEWIAYGISNSPSAPHIYIQHCTSRLGLLLRSTQRDMLEYMRNASGVRWIRLEPDTEYIVLIIPCYVQIVRARLIMLEVQC